MGKLLILIDLALLVLMVATWGSMGSALIALFLVAGTVILVVLKLLFPGSSPFQIDYKTKQNPWKKQIEEDSGSYFLEEN